MEKYDLIGQNYNATRKADAFIVSRILHLLNCKKEDLILDVGCGTGNYTTEISKNGFEITGLEPSKTMVEQAKSKNPDIQWILGNAENLPFENESFNVVMATLTIHHWQNLEKGFSEIFRVLKDDGTFLIFTSTSEQMKNYWLNHYFPEMMQKSVAQMPSFSIIKEGLEKVGFEITETEKYLIKEDLQDKFLYIGKNNPEIYFDESIRKGISSFADLANKNEVEKGLKKLKNDIDNDKFIEIKNQFNTEFGDYLFIKIKKNNAAKPRSG